MLKEIEPMVWSILSKYHGLSKEDMEDYAQEILVFLWSKIIPIYNPSKAKFSSFAWRCITNFINRKIQQSKKRYFSEIEAANIYYSAQEEKDSKAIVIAREKISYFETILQSKQFTLKSKEHEVIEIILENPYITQREISKKMGYRHASAISMMLLRLRKRINKSALFKKT